MSGTCKPGAYPCNASIISQDETKSAIRVCSNGFTATRTATGLILASTQWTKRHPQIIENPLNKRNSRTHQYGQGCSHANS
jgi:hypothetical protein